MAAVDVLSTGSCRVIHESNISSTLVGTIGRTDIEGEARNEYHQPSHHLENCTVRPFHLDLFYARCEVSLNRLTFLSFFRSTRGLLKEISVK